MNKLPGITSSVESQIKTIDKYYQFQAKVYDLTRWSFLFGRKPLVGILPFTKDEAFSVLEVGCGTGYNLLNLAQTYPKATLVGMDLSSDMLAIAKKKSQGTS